jgi:carbon-monoxide dehydrogenase large subunit
VQIVGAAAQSAVQQLVERSRVLAADLLEAAPADVVFEPARGVFSVVGTPARALAWSDLARSSSETLIGESTHQHAAPTFPFGAHAAVVEVDLDTGGVELRRIVVVDDAGVLINPLLAEGQIHGGLAMGIAQALSEGLVIDADGNVRNGTFAEYGILSAAELPSYELVVMETPAPFNPLGAKGVGESGTVGATPAVQSAVIDALAHLGVRHVDMPCTPERVWQAINGRTAS